MSVLGRPLDNVQIRRLDCRLDQRQVTDRSVAFGPGRARGHLPPTDISSK